MSMTRKILLTLLSLLLFSSVGQAQTEFTVTSEGVAGNRDKKGRDPVVSVTRVVETDNVRLLVDAHIRNGEYQQYPIRFDFYVDRHFYVSQIRSPELPGAIGVNIPPELTEPPFTYTVIATLLTPNRVFTTIISGAAFTQDLTGALDCTLTLADGGTLSGTNITVQQLSEDSIFLTFTSGDSTASTTINVGTVNSDGNQFENSTSTITVTTGDIVETLDVTGTVAANISSIELATSGEAPSLSCS